jgi:hypothetical protein
MLLGGDEQDNPKDSQAGHSGEIGHVLLFRHELVPFF